MSDSDVQAAGKGFAGLSHLVSDIKLEKSWAPEARNGQAALPVLPYGRRLFVQPASRDATSFSGGGLIGFGFCILLLVLRVLFSMSNDNPPPMARAPMAPSALPSYWNNTPPSTRVPQPFLFTTPTVKTGPPYAYTWAPPTMRPVQHYSLGLQLQTGGPETPPMPGAKAWLSVPELRYCRFEERRIHTARPLVNLHDVGQVSRFNSHIGEVRNRCVGRKFMTSEALPIQKEVAINAAILDQQAAEILHPLRMTISKQKTEQ